MRTLVLLILVFITWIECTFHRGVFPPPLTFSTAMGSGQFISKEQVGINQLILVGDNFSRGIFHGRLTEPLLQKEEAALMKVFDQIFSNFLLRKLFLVTAITWYRGIEKYFEPWMIEEMWGLAHSTTPTLTELADPLTKQVALHGLHEVGQLMVDQSSESMGCTVIAVPSKNSWLLARSFDFEAGRVFDEEKTMKWVFPTQGAAFLSVAWAGMVGAVTGVNEFGVYISLNAAGSKDFRRLGTPSTLVITKALMNSHSAEEAVRIIRDATMFITDIFVVTDWHSGKLFRVEKSPKATEVILEQNPVAIANHLISPRWANDPINQKRKAELTSQYRESRGLKLAQSISQSGDVTPLRLLTALRDKGLDAHDSPLPLGHRRAVDALIATHGIVFDGVNRHLYVSRGPALSGEFIAFDMERSFNSRKPIITGRLPEDPSVSTEAFHQVTRTNQLIQETKQLVKNHSCVEAGAKLELIETSYRETSNYYATLGDVLECLGKKVEAQEAWRKSLNLTPAYQKEETELRKKIK